MNINCDIIQDVLPLYAEDMVSQATRSMVDDHLKQCMPCRNHLETMKKPAPIPIEVEIGSLKRVGTTIRKNRLLSVLAALSFLLTLLFGAVMFLDARIALTVDQAVEQVEAMENGDIRIYWKDPVVGVRASVDLEGKNYGVIAYSTVHKLLTNEKRIPYEALPKQSKMAVKEEGYAYSTYKVEDRTQRCNFWYVEPQGGRGDTLLWNGGEMYHNWQPLLDSRYSLILWFVSTAILCIFLEANAYVMKRYWKRWLWEVNVVCGIWSGCISASVFIVTAALADQWSQTGEVLAEAFILSLPMAFGILCLRQLYHGNRKESDI